MPFQLPSTLASRAAIIGAAGVALTGLVAIHRYRVAKRDKVARELAAHTADEKVVHLYSFPRYALGPSMSTPCTKVETFLRLAKIPYETHVTMDTSISPTEMLPFIAFRGKLTADSDLIIEYLTREFGLTMDDALTKEQKAIGVAARRMVTYFLSKLHYRMAVVDHYDLYIPYYSLAFKVPPWIAYYLGLDFRCRIIEALNRMGHGDLTDEQYHEEMLRDVKALEAIIGSKPFLLGDTPSSYDCDVYGWVLQMARVPHAATIGGAVAYVQSSEVLMGYVRSMSNVAFPDLDTLLPPL